MANHYYHLKFQKKTLDQATHLFDLRLNTILKLCFNRRAELILEENQGDPE